MSSATQSAASRLCLACGSCCNGVMFHKVMLQAHDSPKELTALGLKLKCKHKEYFIRQPCPAYRESQCTIYQQRPERCRRFECRIIRRVAAGEMSEPLALEKISEVLKRVAHINQLLHEAGVTDPAKPLTKRCEMITAEPLDFSSDPKTMELRNQLTLSAKELEELLDQDFRNDD